MMILLYGIDKYKAIHHHWRVSEKILLIGALFGGSLGAILAMYGFNHNIVILISIVISNRSNSSRTPRRSFFIW